jgi:hypothetical protein
VALILCQVRVTPAFNVRAAARRDVSFSLLSSLP